MISKITEKERAIALRRQGKTYNEILAEVSVSKSSLSLWLREVGMSDKQTQRLTAKRHAAQVRGGQRRREMRKVETEAIFHQAIEDVGPLSHRELFLVGIALYWAEGSKQKAHSPSVGVEFANSDPEMVTLFLAWLRNVIGANDQEISLTIHLHRDYLSRYEDIERYWLEVTKLPRSLVTKPVIKKHNPKTLRKNKGLQYRGLVSIYVRRSTILNRRISGWIHAIIAAPKEYCRIV